MFSFEAFDHDSELVDVRGSGRSIARWFQTYWVLISWGLSISPPETFRLSTTYLLLKLRSPGHFRDSFHMKNKISVILGGFCGLSQASIPQQKALPSHL